MRKFASLRCVAITLLWPALASCGGSDAAGPQDPTPTAQIATVSLDRSSATITVTGRVQLTATARDASGNPITGASVAWSSDNTAVTVSAQGLVTGISTGSATVSAMAGGKTSQAMITVGAGAPGAVAVTPAQAAVIPGEELQLTASSFDNSGLETNSPITWTSSDESIVTIDGSGRVTGVSAGIATLRAAVDGRTANATLTVVASPAYTAIAASQFDVCALATTGTLYCAGKSYGQRARPIAQTLRFKSVDGFGDRGTQISGFCALTTDDRAYCWGSNATGQLGVGDKLDRVDPTAVAGGIQFASISAGDYHTCAIALDGAGYCWGNGAYGALGNGTNGESVVPVPVALNVQLKQISAGNEFSCGLTQQGVAYCWGRNRTGQLGNGAVPIDSNTPEAVRGNLVFRSLNQKNTQFACGVTLNGDLYCWGNSNPLRAGFGQQCPLGDGQLHACFPVPTPMDSPFRFNILIGNSFGGMCGLTGDSQVACWGINLQDRFGLPPAQAAACNAGCQQPRPGPAGFVFIAGSVFTNCGITPAGRAYCWGDNSHRQLTDPAVATSVTPVIFRIDTNL